MKTKLGLVLSSAVILSCSGAKVQLNPNAKFPLPISDSTPAFLFPVNLSHLGSGGDPLKMGLAVTAGGASPFGKGVVSRRQLFDPAGDRASALAGTGPA